MNNELLRAGTIHGEKLPDLRAAPKSVNELAELAVQCDQLAEDFARTIRRLERDIAYRADAAERRWSGVTHLSRDQRRQMVNKEVQQARKEIEANSDKERFTKLRELQALANGAKAARVLFASPVQMLHASNVGSERRSRFVSEFARLGPMALTNMATLAIATDDKEMGAALITIVDELPVSRRPFSGQQLAERLIGDEYRKAQDSLAVARNRFQEAINSNRAFVTGRSSALAKIQMALNRRGEAGILGQP